MSFDPKNYRSHVCLAGLTDGEKDDIINSIALTLRPFIERAFGMHPVQLSLGVRARKFNEITAGDAIVETTSINIEPEESAAPTSEEGGSP